MMIEELNKKILNCRKCEFSCLDENNNKQFELKGYGKLFGRKGKITNDIMLIGLNPSRIRYTGTRHFVWDDSIDNNNHTKLIKLVEILKELNIYEKCYITNSVKCSTFNNKLNNLDFQNCYEFLYEEINLINPKLILAAGRQVYDFLLTKNIKNLERISHPSYYFTYNKGTYSQYKHEFEKILNNYII